MPLLYPLIKQLNPDISKKEFSTALAAMLKRGYRCIGAYDGKALVGAMGIWEGSRFWCGTYMEIDNVVVDKNVRSAGIGKKMSDWVDAEARRLGCALILADSYTHNHPSHRFYLRQRYDILGFRFVKKLGK